MTGPRYTPLADSLPASVPFVGPETQERQRNRPFRARLGANESVFGPSPATVAAMQAGLISVTCLGESLAQREAGDTLAVIGAQLAGSLPDEVDAAKLVIAYEPIWAIGTGLVPTLEQIAEVHDFIRAELTTRYGADTAEGIRILYGGSVKPGNAAEIFAVTNVDGALVGGASLSAADFTPIIKALEAA